MKKILVSAVVASSFVVGAAFAACPGIEGHYSYTCTVARDDGADFGAFIETAGQMVVEQQGCDMYKFIETIKNQSEVIDLNNVDASRTELSMKIKKETDTKLRIRSTRAADRITGGIVGDLSIFVTKETIRTTRSGFVLKGNEKTKFLGIIPDRHSKFSCRFKRI